VPEIPGGLRLYATSAEAASLVLVLCDYLGETAAGVVGAIAIGVGLCLLSYHRGWTLPGKAPEPAGTGGGARTPGRGRW
jgi:uncharacterized membrane protein YeiH